VLRTKLIKIPCTSTGRQTSLYYRALKEMGATTDVIKGKLTMLITLHEKPALKKAGARMGARKK
jgi:hypothetical protein